MGLGLLDIEVTVEVDLDGTPYGGTPVWTDVTDHVLTTDNGAPVQIGWGRQDLWSDISAGTCSFVLDNRDGRFTPGLATSPYYPNVKKRARCRVRCDITIPAGGLTVTDNSDGTADVTGPAGFLLDLGDGTALFLKGGFVDNGDATGTYTGADVVRTVYLFDGLVNSWRAGYTYGGLFGVATASASDMLGRLAAELPLRPMLYEEILADMPAGNTGIFYPLNDQGPTFGNIKNDGGVGTLPIAAFPGAGGPDVVFQNVTGCADPSVTGVGLGGFYGRVGGGDGTGGTTSAFALSGDVPAEIFFTTTFTGYEAVLFADDFDDVFIGIDAAGHIGDGTTAGPFVADGLIHQLVMIHGDGWYCDGVRVGGVYMDTITSLGFNLVGTMWCFAIYSDLFAPSLDRFADHLRAARSGFAGEPTDQHAARILTYRKNFGHVLDPGVGTVGPHNTDGLDMQRALYDTADAEGGVVFADGQGRIVQRARSRMFSPVAALRLDAAKGEIEANIEYLDDVENLINSASITPPSGAVQTYSDDVSIAADGLHAVDETLIVDTDAQAYAAAKWRVQTGVQEQIGAPVIDVDLWHLDDPKTALAVLSTQPLDVVSLLNTAATAPTVGDFMAEGGTINIAANAFDASLVTTVVPGGDPY